MEIIPAILENDYNKVTERISQVVGLVDFVQLDVCDGKFTPSATWPYRKFDENFEQIKKEEKSLPYWDELDYEIDLMVSNPFDVIDSWISAGASRIIVHYESFDDKIDQSDPKSLSAFIEQYRNRFPKAELELFNPELVLAFGTGLNLTLIEPHIKNLDGVQFMGIDKIGFQGQMFNPAIVNKISEFKRNHPDVSVSVDGGVSADNIEALKNAGVDRVAVGSAIFNTENVNQAIAELFQIAKGK